MDHPKTFLLRKIVGYNDNGLKSLGTLHAKHFDDIVEILKDYGETLLDEVIERLNKGETITTFNHTLSLKKKK